jgi:hypothetical protein
MKTTVVESIKFMEFERGLVNSICELQHNYIDTVCMKDVTWKLMLSLAVLKFL